MDAKAYLTARKELRARWQEANQGARAARAECTRAYAECAQGRGTGPSIEQLDEADRLEQLADRLAIEMDQLADNFKG